MPSEEQKPVVTEPPSKSSMEILSELFNSFDAEPPVIVKTEKPDASPKKSKKPKKKHKHKEKKKKKDKKRKKDSSPRMDLAEILIKQEKETSEQKIKIEGTDLSFSLSAVKVDEDRKKRKRKSERSKSPKRKVKVEPKEMDEKELQLKINDLRNKIKGKRRSKSRERDRRSESRDGRGYKFRERDRSREFRDRDKDRYKRKDNAFYKEEEPYRRSRDRRHRDRSPSRDSSYIDKKKLLEIARRNAIQMMKSGSLPGALTLGPQAQEKVIAAIKAGGKTIEELTDFCKTLSKQEELGELSSNSGNESDSDTDKAFHHPFQIKDRPTSITMNIKNSVPLPIKSTQERTSELRIQFPVSSGQLHRKTENDWTPVVSKKPEMSPPSTKNVEVPTVTAPETVPVPPNPGPQVFPKPPETVAVDIGSIVSQRLTAIRKLQENPNDVQALTEMYKSNQEMQSWAESKQHPGQFTGSTGAQVLSQAELSSGYQAWAKKVLQAQTIPFLLGKGMESVAVLDQTCLYLSHLRICFRLVKTGYKVRFLRTETGHLMSADQLTSATPVSGGMGMHLLQKMGWKPGEGLGKEKTGTLEPLLLEVKLDKKGLVAIEEQKKKKRQGQPQVNLNALQNKHPVSLLGEYASKRKLGAPQYNLCFECGPDHKKNFLFKVILNGVEYQPNVASPNKKEAKAAAATVCLQHLGLLLQ